MLRAHSIVFLAVGVFAGVLSLRLSVSRAHAQSTAATPATDVDSGQPTAPVWRPKRFPRLYALPPQTRDDERAPQHVRDDKPVRNRSGLLIGGLTTFAASYMVTAMFSLLILDQISAADCKAGYLSADACDAGARLRIPLVGPWLRPVSQKLGTVGTVWFGGTQLFGAVLTVLGIVRLATGGEPSRATASLALQPVPLPGGGLLALHGMF